MNNLIFYESVVEPPSESLAIRGVCIYLNTFQRKRRILLEAEEVNIDIYYKWAKHTGLWDFVEDMISPKDNIFGLRIANKKVRSPFIKLEKISFDNLNHVLTLI